MLDFDSTLFVGSALVVRALIENSNMIKWSLLLKAFYGLLALICGNGYIVGINQIYDIEIDKYATYIYKDFTETDMEHLEYNFYRNFNPKYQFYGTWKFQ